MINLLQYLKISENKILKHLGKYSSVWTFITIRYKDKYQK